ncbi:Sapep family Mn(2+)-dependent dipeptidase [Lachnobacterium bovis]|uniref:Sapep family Mn(2+)-dependent dipeptidase n=1 Tax=Lachnobacterium bovis TaxID=140626 RepID=UPI0003B5F33C|nr:Sapep family Mn(2+)-dependent dipeptidase [Lachnobacterium bovis]
MDNQIIKEKVWSYKDEMLDRLEKLISIQSEMSAPTADAPFGEKPLLALTTALEMLEKDGFETKNVDNYAGYAQMGEGEELIGVVGHLDVVPAKKSDGWDTDPYTLVEKDGVLYGRGVADDKGAVVASMIAMKVIKDLGIDVNKRVRLIMGTNEENGSRCLEHYVEKEGHVDYGFTPDGDFPAIHGEKGIMQGKYVSKTSKIIDICGGTVANAVPGKVSAKVVSGSYSAEKLDAFFKENDIKYTLECKDDCDVIEVMGVAAHASTPDLGVNAISYLVVGLKEAGMQDEFVDFYCTHFGLELNGAMIGADLSDEYGNLTLNCGVISMKDGMVEGTVDIRFPVTLTTDKVLAAMEGHLEDSNGKITFDTLVNPLFFAPDSPLVSSLYEAYVEVTGDTENKPMVIGGGTYAKEINNTIAFGCAFPGYDYRIHNTNEWVKVDELLLQAEIYVHGILKLLAI